MWLFMLTSHFSSPARLLTGAPRQLCACVLGHVIPFSTDFSLYFLLEKSVCVCVCVYV